MDKKPQTTQQNGERARLGPHRRPFPLDPVRFGGIGTQLFEAQGGRRGREGVVPEEGTALQALVPKPLEVLTQVFHRILMFPQAQVFGPLLLDLGRDARAVNGHDDLF